MKHSFSALFLTAALLPAGAFAQSCDAQLAALKESYTTKVVPTLMAALSGVRSAGCAAETERSAMTQTSAVLARWAQEQVAAGDLDKAEEVLSKAPALHWAVQTIRGDIAAKRANRQEAAQMYSAALDTITDPSLTPPNPALVPIADRIARLAQENLMLSGSLSAAVTRGGQASGVLKSAVRGIRIEAVGTAPTPKEAETKAPAPAPDLYAKAPKEDYVVADAVAASVGPVFLPIRFAFGSDQLDASGQKEAHTVAAFLLANKLRRISVVGHTDEIGTDASNLDLSVQRARTVKHVLEAKGVYAQIEVIGKGESEPPVLVDYAVYSDEERRQIARRVELVLHE